MAVRDMAGARAAVTLIAPDMDFVYKPLIVGEPFSSEPTEQHALAPIAEEFGAEFVQEALTGVDAGERVVKLGGGSSLGYDKLVICVGARPREAFEGVTPLRTDGTVIPIDSLLREAEASESGVIAFVIPAGPSWPLPAYELALMGQRRARELGIQVKCMIVTPEPRPLIVFGSAASDAVDELLAARQIEFRGGARVKDVSSGELILAPQDERIQVGQLVSLPVLEGPSIPGVPADERGFIPIDDHARVRGIDDVYAAGDGTNFPIKHGGIGTEEADAAAEHLAASLGAELTPQPFHPVIRGKLLTGDDSLHMQHTATGGGGEGTASPDYLWWPPRKVAGKYLSAWLSHRGTTTEFEPGPHSLDVEISVPKDWHEDPMGLDPLGPL